MDGEDPFTNTCVRVCLFLSLPFCPSCSFTLHRVARTGIMPGMGGYAFEPRTERIRISQKPGSNSLFQTRIIRVFTNYKPINQKAPSNPNWHGHKRTGDVIVYEPVPLQRAVKNICFIPFFKITECTRTLCSPHGGGMVEAEPNFLFFQSL